MFMKDGDILNPEAGEEQDCVQAIGKAGI